MAYRLANAHLSGYVSSYPYTPRMSGYAQQQDLGPDSPDLLESLTPLPGDDFLSPHFRPMQSVAPASFGPPGQPRSAQAPLPAQMPRFRSQSQSQSQSQQPLIISPSTRRFTSGPLERLLKNDSPDHLDLIDLSDGGKSIDKLVLPSEMPIGSLVHFQRPQKWGVVRIANIPYSITKQEIVQFLGRQACLIGPDKGCPIHIIMERSTAKTMDCYVELQTFKDAQETVTRINKIFETGRAPRLGNRVVYVELSNQDELLRDLFPRAKCVSWQDGMPIALPNRDPYSTGFAGFLTSEEILGAIRHAEIPHRSPFCAKCPQRTYESTISTLYKFPWYATQLYTIHDRNTLFELVNRHIKSLAFRLKNTKTIGLDQRLLRDLLYAGLNCPTFNERQKFTLCANSEDISEILKFPDMGKWFPFDTLVRMPAFEENTLLYYAKLISKGSVPDTGDSELPNTFPMTNFDLESPYGCIWFEWPLDVAKRLTWEEGVQHEMVTLCNLVLSGWISHEKDATFGIGDMSLAESITSGSLNKLGSNSTISPFSTENTSQASDEAPPPPPLSSSHPKTEIYATPHRRARDQQQGYTSAFSRNSDGGWSHRLVMRPSDRVRPAFMGHHRNTLSSPCFLPTTREDH